MARSRDELFQEWLVQQPFERGESEVDETRESKEVGSEEEFEPEMVDIYGEGEGDDGFDCLNDEFGRVSLSDEQFHALQARTSQDVRKSPIKGCY